MEFSMRFVNQFMEFSFLQKARNSAVQDWGEDIPMTVLFFPFLEKEWRKILHSFHRLLGQEYFI